MPIPCYRLRDGMGFRMKNYTVRYTLELSVRRSSALSNRGIYPFLWIAHWAACETELCRSYRGLVPAWRRPVLPTFLKWHQSRPNHMRWDIQHALTSVKDRYEIVRRRKESTLGLIEMEFHPLQAAQWSAITQYDMADPSLWFTPPARLPVRRMDSRSFRALRIFRRPMRQRWSGVFSNQLLSDCMYYRDDHSFPRRPVEIITEGVESCVLFEGRRLIGTGATACR